MLFPICIFSQIAIPNNQLSSKSKSQRYFIENKGQIVDQNENSNPDVNYLLNTPSLNVQLKKNGFSYDLYEREPIDIHKISKKQPRVSSSFYDSIPIKRSKTKFHRLDFEFLNISPDLRIIPYEQVSHKMNYYNVKDRPEGITGVRGFKRVVYKNIYNHIDLEFYVPSDINKPVEYNFIIRPQGKLTDIKMRVQGAKVNYKKSYIEIETEFGILKEIIPLSWIGQKEQKKEIKIEYQKLNENVFGFTSKSDLASNSIITIDPTPVRQWATYYGGERGETRYNGDVETDSNGNIFISGFTRSVNNIATVGSYQITYTNNTGSWVGYLSKFSSDGDLIWGTYYGNGQTSFRGITIDNEDNIIGVGDTSSTNNIATNGTHQPNIYNNTYGDAFVVKFNNSGIRIWGTYYGGESTDTFYGTSVDSNNNILITGQTKSHENIATQNSFRETATGLGSNNRDCIIVKLNEDGQRIWATYYGGDIGVDIDVDNSDNVYVLGEVSRGEADFEDISTTGAYQEAYSDEGNSSWVDSFLVKFNTNGQRQWGTFFGGDSYDFANGLVIDHIDNVIICGATRSNIFQTTNAFQPNKGGAHYDWDAYLAKFNPDGQIMWNTFYGGDEQDTGVNVDVDNDNNIFLTGGTGSFDSLGTSDGYQNESGGYEDAYIAKFNPSGDRLWGTYYGGADGDHGLDIEVTSSGDLYLLGYTFGSTTLATSGAHQETFNGETDNFIVKFKDCLSSIQAGATEFICVGEDIEFTSSGGISYEWSGPNGFNSILANPVIPNATVLDSGEYKVFIESPDGCNDERVFNVLVSTVPSIGIIDDLISCEDEGAQGYSSEFDTSNVEAQAVNGQTNVIVSYFNSNGDELPSPLPNPMTNSLVNQETITVRVANKDNLDCYSETSFDLIVNPNPIANTVDDFYVCDDDYDRYANFDLSGISSIVLGQQIGFDVELYNEAGTRIQNPLNSYINSIPNQETITVKVINTITNCYVETTFRLVVNSLPITTNLETIIGCDDNGDGISEYFDTSSVENDVLGGQIGMEVTYYDHNGIPLPNPLPNPITNTVAFNQDITVRVTNPNTNCFSETILTLESATQPNINQPQILYACDEGNGIATFNTSAVESQIIGNQLGLDVYYFDNNGNALPSPLPINFQNTTPYTQTINVRVENSLNTACYSETSFGLIVNELPSINLEEDYFICNLDPSITISVNQGYDSYDWQFEDGTTISTANIATLIDEGDYTITVTRLENGIICNNSFSFHLTRSVLPVIQTVNYDELGNNFIEIIASGDGDFEYSIDGVNYQDSNYFSDVIGGTYTVFVRDKEGCGEDSEEVTLIDYPKYFTPNNDGYHDHWHIYGINEYPNAIVYIFDRYGKLLKQLNSQSLGWDGTFNGKLLTGTDYWFTANLGNGKIFKGHFALKK